MKKLAILGALAACGQPALAPVRAGSASRETPALPAPQGRPPPAISTDRLDGLAVRIHLRARRGGVTFDVAPDDTLHTGDHVELRVAVNATAYVYVVQLLPGGESTVLFPAAGDLVLASGTPTRIPLAPNAWFQLDDAAGTETVYVIASRDPLSTVDGMLDEEIRAIRDAGGAPTPAVQPVPVVAKQPVSDSAAGTSKPPPRARRPERMLTMANRGLHEVVESAGRSVVDTMIPVNDGGVVVAWFSFRHER